jgi:hypothetical protein
LIPDNSSPVVWNSYWFFWVCHADVAALDLVFLAATCSRSFLQYIFVDASLVSTISGHDVVSSAEVGMYLFDYIL